MGKKNIFKKADWINNTNIYEVNLRQYTAEGTINAFMKELPRLKDMGLETLWFMPITPISEKNRKGSMGSYYACSDYTAVNPEFGSMDDFKSLVQTAHAMGFKVVIDWVANHTGWDHVWTIQHPEYYQRDAETGDFKKASGMDDIIELDFENPALRNAMINAMEFWIRECDIDGFRCDLAFWVRLDFWKEARAYLEKIKTLFWLAEADPLDNPDYLEAFDAAYTWTWMHKTEEFYKQDIGIEILKATLEKYDAVCGNHSIPLWFTSNHDENSWNGTEYEKYGAMAELLAVFSCTWNGIPLIYSGQELPNMKRLLFFEKDVIEWDQNIGLHGFYKKLLELHSTHPALHAADPAVTTFMLTDMARQGMLAFIRRKGDREVLVVLNFNREEKSFHLPEEYGISSEFYNIFNDSVINFSKEKQLLLGSWGYCIYQK